MDAEIRRLLREVQASGDINAEAQYLNHLSCAVLAFRAAFVANEHEDEEIRQRQYLIEKLLSRGN